MKYDHYDFWNEPVYNPILGYRIAPLNEYMNEKTERCKYVRKSNRLPNAESASVAGGSSKQGTADRLAD